MNEGEYFFPPREGPGFVDDGTGPPKFRHWIVVFKGGPQGQMAVRCATGKPEAQDNGTILKMPWTGIDESGNPVTTDRYYPMDRIEYWEEVTSLEPPPGFFDPPGGTGFAAPY